MANCKTITAFVASSGGCAILHTQLHNLAAFLN